MKRALFPTLLRSAWLGLTGRGPSSARRATHRPAMLEPLEDRIAPAAFIVTTTADAGAGSLRAAILSAEADAAPDTITFNIPGPGVHTIALASALPQITHPVTIDATTEPGYANQPIVELNGSLTSGAEGLTISSGNVTVKALIINRFGSNGIDVTGGSGSVSIQGCFIGVDATGTVASPNGGHGILIQAPGCNVGGHTAADRNVIAGNLKSGVLLYSTGSFVRGNYIGTNLLASLQIPNGGDGLSVQGGSGNIFGGTAPGEGNVVSGNKGNDIAIIGADNNLVAGNTIGLDLALQVELQSKGHGIYIAGNSSGNVIGGTSSSARNVIAAHDENNRAGIYVDGFGSGNTVLGNLIGTNPDGDDELQNTIGIYITASGTVVGDLAGHGNFIAGNLGNGIQAYGAQNLQLLGNHIGIYNTLEYPLANNGGVYIFGGTNVAVTGNIISGNNGNGLTINNSLNATIQGNFIGTNTAGTLARPNTGTGLSVINCPGLLVGGSAAGQGNLLSGNGIYGLDINSAQPVKVFGNFIGTEITGAGALPDGDSGIRVVGGSGHLIGGAGAGEGNVVSGSFRGVQLATSGNFVRGNIIGLNKDASNRLYDLPTNAGGAGVYIYAGANNVIGGILPGEGNIIGGNVGIGVLVDGNGTNNQILGNLIGTNAAGAPSLGNGGVNTSVNTIVVTAPGTVIGGPGAARNIIDSGSGRAINLSNAANAVVQGNWIGLAPDGVTKLGNLAGIALSGTGTTNAKILDNVISGNAAWAIAGTDNGGHIIKGNRIGTDAAGMVIVANGYQGITLTRETNVTIGGTAAGEGNLIAGSGIDAILLTGGTNISILGNRIGLNAAGTAALPNWEGVSINSSTGNLTSGILVAGNLIAGTKDAGLNLSGPQTDTRIQSNVFGLAANGIDPLPNYRGIAIGHGSGILIGGTAGQGNTIASSKDDGVTVFDADSGNLQFLSNILKNNTGSGLAVLGSQGPITIGNGTGGGNNLSSNGGPGLLLDGTKGVVVQGNAIQANGSAGILVKNAALGNTIGGAAAGAENQILGNAGAGVAILGGHGTLVTHNVISGNAGLAIDLDEPGPTPNDADDADTGANGLQNAPVLTGVAVLPNGHTLLLGSLGSAAGHSYRLEVFGGTGGTAEHFVMETTLATAADGSASFQLDLGVLPAGEQVIASATDLATGETSELGGSLSTAPVVPTVTVSDASVLEGNAGTVSAVFTVTLSATPTLPVTFQYATLAGTALAGVDFSATAGSITFLAGASVLTATITVPVLGDLLPEAAEHFAVKLSAPQNVHLLGDTGDGVILNDDSTLSIVPGGKVAHWRDLDGDLVTLKVSKPVLSPDDFVFLADGQGGEQLAALLLADDAGAAKTSLKLSARRDPLYPQGNAG